MNKTYIPIAPDKPIALNERPVLTYLPKLAYSNPGVMKFTAEHFVVNKGEVVINQQFWIKPRILVSIEEPTLDSVQMWYKWLYNYIHLGGNITDTLSIADDLYAQAASSASSIISLIDSAIGYSATVFKQASMVDIITFNIDDNRLVGIKQPNLTANNYDTITLLANATGLPQRDRKSNSSDNITLLANATGIPQLNRQSNLSDTITLLANASGISQQSSSSNNSDNIKLLANATGTPQLNRQSNSSDNITLLANATGIPQFDYSATYSDLTGAFAEIILLANISGVSQQNSSSNSNDSITLLANASGVSQQGSSSNSSDNITLLANASGNADEYLYEVNFYGKDSAPPDTPLKTQFVLENKHATPPTPPIIPGFEFDYWNGSYTYVTADVNIYAIYSILYYSVTFLNWNDTEVYVQTNLTYGQSATPPTVTRTGHTFSHWTVSYQNITGNVTTKAVFNINTYTITWQRYGTTGTNGTVTTNTVNYGTIVDAPNGTTDTVYYDYEWNEYRVAVYADETIYETRTQKSYLVRWYYFGGSAHFPETYIDTWVLAGSTVEAPSTNTEWTARYSYYWPVASVSDITAHQTYGEVRATRYYTVIWKDYDGTVIQTFSYDYGTWINATDWPDNPSRDGYVFDDWVVSPVGADIGNITQNMIITATYVLVTYPVTWKYANGTVAKTEYVVSGSVSNAPATTTWTNYVMYYWPSESYTITQDLVITEQFADRYYTITWRRYGTNGTNGTATTNSVTYGTYVDAPATTTWTPQYSYYWQEYRATGGIDEIIYEIRYLRYYTITFEYNYDTPQTTQSVAYGGTATGFAPTRVGYTFGGWFTNYNLNVGYDWNDPIAEDRTLYAKWTPKTYTVTWLRSNGVPERVDSNKTYDTVLIAPKTGSIDDDYNTYSWPVSSYIVRESLDIWEISTPVTYTVTFKDWNGTTLKTQTVNAGTSATPPSNPSRTGYTFTGWSGTYTNVTNSKTVTAQYTQKTYTVNYYDWDNTLLHTEQVLYMDDANPPANPTRLGYVFLHWSYYQDLDSVAADIDTTAIYSANNYTLSYDGNGGTSPSSKTVTYGSTYGTLGTPIRTNYTFNGWFTASSGGTKVTSATTVTKAYDHTIYAQWTSNVGQKYWASSTVSVYNVSPNKLTFQGEVEILNPSYDGCTSGVILEALLPDANSYSVDTVARVNVYGYPQALCSTWRYYKVSL